MSTRSLVLAEVGLIAGLTLLFSAHAELNQPDDVRAQSETTIEVKTGTTQLDMNVGGMRFTYAKIEFSQASAGFTRVRLKVAGSNGTDEDHDAEVQAILVGPGDEQLSTLTKKREIEEGENNKELTFDFRVTPEQLSAGLKFKLLLSYVP